MAGPIGLRINNYEITSLIGEGGMGAVYLALHTVTGRKAAIKLLRRELAQDKNLVARFVNEAKAAAAIRHPNIIDVIDVGTLPPDKGEGLPYMMMDFLEGESLARRLEKRGRLEVAEAVDIAAQTAAALGAAHAKGIVHRDLKPDNLFLVPDDMNPGRERVKVLDFGIAKLRGEIGSGSVKTSAGSIMGTPPYMSPEQCRGIVEEVDNRTDVYALGIILYEMLCGAPPFLSPGYGEILVMHLTQPPAAPRSKNPGIPETLEQTMLRTLAKSADERYASMAELQAALGRIPTAGNWRAVHAPTPVEVAPTMHATPPPRAPTPAPQVPLKSLTPKSTTFSATTGIIEGVEGRRRSRRAWLFAGVAALVVAGGFAARSLLRPTVASVHSGGAPVDQPRIAPPPPPPPVVTPPEPAKVQAPVPEATPEPAQPARRSSTKRTPVRRARAVAADAVAAPVAPAPPPPAAAAPTTPPAPPPPAKKPAEKW